MTNAVILVALGLLALAMVFILVVGAISFVFNKVSVDSAHRTRWLLGRALLTTAGDRVHRTTDIADGISVASGIVAIKAADPAFDEIALIDAARRALFFTFVAQSTGDRRRFQQVTTEAFWSSPGAKQLSSSIDEAARRRVGSILNLDFQAADATLMEIDPAVDGTTRVRLRIAYRSRSVSTGDVSRHYLSKEDRQHRSGPFNDEAAAPSVADTVAQWDQHGWYDWDLVRPVGTQSASDQDGWRCIACGAPFHSDLDVDCSHCHRPRTLPEGAWKLDRAWLVLE